MDLNFVNSRSYTENYFFDFTVQEHPIELKQRYQWVRGFQWKHHIFQAIEDPHRNMSCHLFCEAYEECNFFLDHVLDRSKPDEHFCLLGGFSADSYKDLSYMSQYPADSVKDVIYVVKKDDQNEIRSKYEPISDSRFTHDAMTKLIFDKFELGPDSESLCAQLCYLGTQYGDRNSLYRNFYSYENDTCFIGSFTKREPDRNNEHKMRMWHFEKHLLNGPFKIFTDGQGDTKTIEKVEEIYRNMMIGPSQKSSRPFGSYSYGEHDTNCGDYYEVTESFTLEIPEASGPGADPSFCIYKLINKNPNAKLKLNIEDKKSRRRDRFWIYYGPKPMTYPVPNYFGGYGDEDLTINTSVDRTENDVLTFEWRFPAVTIVRVTEQTDSAPEAKIEYFE